MKLVANVATNTWLVDYQGTDQETDIRILFGGTVVPTPYTLRMPQGEVIVALAARGTIIN